MAYSTSDILPDEFIPVNLTVYVPSGAEAGPYITKIKATSSAEPNATSVITITTNVRQFYKVSVNVQGVKSVEPGAGNFVDYDITVRNDGNGQDYFSLITYVDPLNPDWSAEVSQSTTTTLDPAEDYNVTLYVYPPLAADAGSKGYVWVNATSEYDPAPSPAEKSSKSTTIIDQKYNLALSGVTTSANIDPGATGMYQFYVENTGNGEDSVEVDFEPSSSWSRNIEPSAFSIDDGPSNKELITINLTTPDHIASGNYYFKVYVNSTESTVSRWITITCKINQEYDVKVEPQTGQSTLLNAHPGETIKWYLQVVNLGNGADDYSVNIEGDDQQVIDDWNPSPGISSIKDLASDAAYNLTVTAVAPSNATTGTYEFNVNVSSDNDPGVWFILPLKAVIPQLYYVDITANAESAITDLSTATLLRKVYFDMDVFNLGSGDDDLKVEVSSFPTEFQGLYTLKFIDTSSKIQMVTSGLSEEANLTIEIPKKGEIAPATYDFKVKVITQNGTPGNTLDDKFEEILLSVTVRHMNDMLVYAGSTQTEMARGESFQFNVSVKNIGTNTDSFNTSEPLHLGPYGSEVYVTIPEDKLTTAQLAEDEVEVIPVTLHIAQDADQNLALVQYRLTWYSVGDNSVMKQITIKANIAAEYAGTLSTSDDFEEGIPDSVVSFNITLENRGTVIDKFRFEKDDTVPFENVKINNVTISNLGIAAKASTWINVTVPDDMEVGTYDVIIWAISEGPSAATESDDVEADFITLQVKILQVYGVSAYATDSMETADPGNEVGFELTIKNEGNGEDDFKLEPNASDPNNDDWAELSTGQVKLALDVEGDGEEVKVLLNITVPSDAAPGDEMFRIEIQSINDETKTTFVDFTVRVKQKFKLELSSTDVTNDADPGNDVPVVYEIRVKNSGTGLDHVELELETSEASSWATVSSPQAFSIASKSIKTVFVNVSNIPDDTDAGDYLITLKVTSLDTTDTVEDTLALTVTVNPKREYELEADEEAKEVTPELSGDYATVEYTITIFNKGTGDDAYKIKFQDNPDEKWKIDEDSVSENSNWPRKLSRKTTSSVSAGGQTTITVTLEIPNGEQPVSGGFITVVNITSPGEDDGAIDDLTAYITLTTTIEQAYGMDLQYKTPKKGIGDTPGAGEIPDGATERELNFTFTIQNTGTDTDKFKVELDDTTTKKDWAEFDIGVFELEEGGLQTVVLTVTIPIEEPVKDYKFTVRVTSQGDDDDFDDNDEYDTIQFTAEITQWYEVDVLTTSTTEKVDPGDTASFTFTVVNLGNANDNVQLKLPESGQTADVGEEDYDYDWGWSVSRSPVPLGPADEAGTSDEEAVTLSAQVPNDAVGGTYYVLLEVYSQVKSREELMTEIQFKVTVDKTYGVELTSSNNVLTKEGEAEDTISFDVDIRNEGSVNETFRLSIENNPRGWNQITTKDSTITVGPYETVTFTVDVEIPGLDDAEDINADEDYSFDIKAQSLKDSDTKDSMTFTVEVEPEHSLTLSSDSAATTTAESIPAGEATEVNINVENLGNIDDTVRLTWANSNEFGSDWSHTFTPSSVSVDVAGKEETTFKLTPPADAEPGERVIKIRGTSSDGTRAELLELTYDIDAIDLVPVEIRVNPGTAVDGESVKFTAVIRNDGTKTAEDVEVKFYIDGQLVKDLTEIVDVPVTDATSGPTEVTVTFDAPADTSDISFKVYDEEGDQWGKEKKDTLSIEEKGALGDFLSGEDATRNFMVIVIVLALVFMFIGVAIGRKGSGQKKIREELDEAKKEGSIPEFRAPGTGLPGTAAEKDLLTKGDEDGAAKDKKKSVKVKCPKCETIQKVTSKKRPLEIECVNCGMKLMLKDKKTKEGED